MKNRAAFFLVGAFLLMSFGVGIAQAVLDLRNGERPQAFDLLTQAPTEENLRTYEKGLEDGSWFAQQARPWMQAAMFAMLRDPGENGVLGRDNWFFYRPGVEYLIKPMPHFERSGDPVDAIVAFRDALEARGIHLLMVPAPGKASVYPDQLTVRAAGLSGQVSGHTREIIARLEAAGVEVVNLLDRYAAARQQQEEPPYYLSRDTHWSPAGMALAAKVVAARLLELGWARKGAVAYDLKAAPVMRPGDVLRMMRATRIEAAYPAEQAPCEQVIRQDTGALYEDDPASEVLVLGDSFLRIYQRDEPGNAGFVAHLARELAMPLSSIINDGGASTLVRQELARKPELLQNKKVVVWEFVERDIRFGAEGWQTMALPAAQ